jgi:hypothetical protein
MLQRRKSFLQGLKPVENTAVYVGAQAPTPEEKDFFPQPE